MKKLLFVIGVVSGISLQATEKLGQYYTGKIDLSEEEILGEIDQTIHQYTSHHLVAYAYYLKAVRLRRAHKNFRAYEYYDKAIAILFKSDTTDHFLHHAILTNQGVILKHHGLASFAINKYREALAPAFKYSIKQGLSVKYNLGRAMMYEDPEEALKIFMEELEIAKKEGLPDRMAKAYYEIGQLFLHAEQFEESIEYFEKAVNTAESDKVKFRAIHNLSRPYDHTEQFLKQKEILIRALRLQKEGAIRFTSLMDLGECLLELGQKDSAITVLTEAEAYYNSQPLNDDNVKLYKWLALASGRNFDHAWKRGDELQKIVETKEKLEVLLKRQAMLQLINRLELEKTSDKIIGAYQILAIVGGVVALIILFTWRIWWYRVRKRVGRKISEVVRKWEEV
ncbi:MAG: tetratricopeptide repeat protein [Ekhidna sp.]